MTLREKLKEMLKLAAAMKPKAPAAPKNVSKPPGPPKLKKGGGVSQNTVAGTGW